MEITQDNIGELPIDNFVEVVAGIYREQDKNRSIWDIWLHATHHAASIGEEARKYKPGTKLLVEIADFAMWLFTFVGKIKRPIGLEIDRHGIEASAIHTDNEKDFSDLIWYKYPKLCPVCFWRRYNDGIKMPSDLSQPCDCLLYPIESRDQSEERAHLKRLQEYAKQHYKDKPNSVDEWQKMFQDIYLANLRHLNLVDISFHLLEEVGEVSDSMARMYTYGKEDFKDGEPTWRRIGLENEIADVTSWMFALINHLELMPEIVREFQKFMFKSIVMRDTPPITLSGIIWSRYGDENRRSLYCPHICKKQVCECPILLVKDKDSLAKMKTYMIDVLT